MKIFLESDFYHPGLVKYLRENSFMLIAKGDVLKVGNYLYYAENNKIFRFHEKAGPNRAYCIGTY